jgi:hypothetical protein
MSEVVALENRVTRLETQISAGFERIEKMLRAEINDLKTEQINDLREANKRLADDQRRAWEAIESLRRREEQRTGGSKAFDRIWNIVSALIGGALALCGSWLSTGKHL